MPPTPPTSTRKRRASSRPADKRYVCDNRVHAYLHATLEFDVKKLLRKNVDAGRVPENEEAERFAKAKELIAGLMVPMEPGGLYKEIKSVKRVKK